MDDWKNLRKIIHIDMDAFYASVEQRDDPALLGLQIREIFLTYTPVVEPLALDEAFLDVIGSTSLFGPAESMFLGC